MAVTVTAQVSDLRLFESDGRWSALFISALDSLDRLYMTSDRNAVVRVAQSWLGGQ